MYRPRIIPVLLLKDNALVKSSQFKNHKYIGDPLHTVKIFNELKADEILFLDIEASKRGKLIDVDLVRQIGEEANVPFGVGGGIKTIDDIKQLIQAGAEKVIICSEAIQRPEFITEASEIFGSSTICVCLDLGKSLFGGTKLFSKGGTEKHSIKPFEFAKKMEKLGAGEIIVQSIDRDGMMTGYNYFESVIIAKSVSIPVTILGGAGQLNDIKLVHEKFNFNGYAAGSIFVYYGIHRGVLLNYPERDALQKIFS
ncbi:MAG: imidazole glycerol phosphate synthase subunit HisF [Bacteroidetes bacterium]|nr:imidazole glycerol phosphate synthase subunit HisF [Bacteroidota bacterium]